MTLDTGVAKFRKVPRLTFGYYATPVEEMPRLRTALGGGPRLYIKHDDYTGPGRAMAVFHRDLPFNV